MTRPALPLQVRAELFSHLATMEDAGVPVERSFASLVLPPAHGPRLQAMRAQLAQGRDLAGAGARCALFTPLEVSLLGAAQNAGSPAPMYRRLAERYARLARERKQVRARLLMPAAVLLIALVVQPLPRLVDGSLGVLGYLWAVALPLLVAACVAFAVRELLRRLEQPSGRHDTAGRLLASLPLLGPAYLRRNLRDFFECLGLLLDAGVPMLEALPRARASLSNAALREQLRPLEQHVEAGLSLEAALRRVGEFPGKARLMVLVSTGEASGTLAQTLLAHTRHESEALADFQAQLATWLPRLGYLLVAGWMAWSLLSGGGFSPTLPEGL